MGLEPTTFCMASGSCVRSSSRPFAQTSCLGGFRPSERTRPNPSERRTLPFLPRSEVPTPGSTAFSATATAGGFVRAPN
jgi:hypothetical protein